MSKEKTLIKRLKQGGKEFVPITLAEAVVVNPQYINGSTIITTLDTILGELFGKDIQLQEKIDEINNQAPALKAGHGIIIEEDGTINVSKDILLPYEIIDQLPEQPSSEYANKILLTKGADGFLSEYICIQISDAWQFEQIGEVQIVGEDINTDLFVQKSEYEGFTTSVQNDIKDIKTDITDIKEDIADIQNTSITAMDVTTSDGKSAISVNYTIPNDLYDSMVGEGNDQIV